MVRFEGISKTYPAYRGKPGVNALQNIDFAIPRGSITGVIGRSGAGKSSLVRLINGLEKPTTGRVIVDGRDISALAGRELRLAQRSIGMPPSTRPGRMMSTSSIKRSPLERTDGRPHQARPASQRYCHCALGTTGARAPGSEAGARA